MMNMKKLVFLILICMAGSLTAQDFKKAKDQLAAKQLDVAKTTIDAGGLRYRSKVAGSPFSATGAFGAATMSCFLCGKHRPRAQLKSRKLLGKTQFVCSPYCKEVDGAGA